MIAAEVAKRYAHGLFLFAVEKGTVDTVYSEIKELDAILEQDRSLLDFFAAPQVTDKDKFAVVRAVFRGKVSRMLEEFLMLIVAKRRNPYLRGIIDEFENLVLTYKGFVKTKIVSAVPLSESEKKSLIEKLAAKSGKKVKAVTEVDPSIIGGVIVFLGDQIIDKSIRHQLDTMRDELFALKVH
jgi:F-type H+-transporting ATPase subunit delta